MIKLSNICKEINGVQILKNINLKLEAGEFVAIMGQSGSGKSTLLNILGTLDVPTSGTFTFNGLDVKNLTPSKKARLRREEIGFIFQRYNLLSLLCVKDNVALPAIYAAKPSMQRNERVDKLLASLNLANKKENNPSELSGGQQQRVSIARALMNHPSVILADEPTGALDSASGAEVLEILRKLNALGQSIIIVTHDKEIASFAQRIIHIKDGQIISEEKNANFKQIAPSKDFSKDRKKIDKDGFSSFYYYKTQFSEALKMSISSIYAQKLRSLLTMLGIIIGIASVVCVSAIGLGTKEKVLKSISQIGTNTIQIVAGRSLGDIHEGRTRLFLSDLAMLKKLKSLDAVEAYITRLGISTYKEKSLRALLFGIGQNHLRLRGLKLAAGRSIGPFDVYNNSNVAVIDNNTRKFLFKGKDAKALVGKTLIYDKKPLHIIGVLKPKDDYGMGDDTVRIYTPYTTFMNKLGGQKRLKAIVVKVAPGYDSLKVEKNIIKLLSFKRGKKDFYTINSTSIQKSIEENAATLMLLISFVAFISLLVGGIGVMNIMLVCVYERTSEIGIKMAIGARRIDVLIQFLLEAVLVCFLGSLLGLLLSFAIILGFNAAHFPIKMLLSPTALILSPVSSIIIGVFFGFFPAKNASKLDPIKALM